MFDLVTGSSAHLPRHQGLPIVLSTAAQILVGALVLAVPYLYVTDRLPEPASAACWTVRRWRRFANGAIRRSS